MRNREIQLKRKRNSLESKGGGLMNFYLAWLVVGLVIGWAFKAFVPGQRALLPAVVLGVIGSFVGGMLANSLGRAAVLGPSVMGAVLGATLLSAVLLVYQLRQNRA